MPQFPVDALISLWKGTYLGNNFSFAIYELEK